MLSLKYIGGNKIKLYNFTLKTYNFEDKIHKKIVQEISQDEKGSKFLGSIENNIEIINKRKEEDYLNNNAYIAYYNDEPVGYISLTHYTEMDNEIYEIASGLLKEQRGYYLGALILQEFSEKIFEERPNINKLTLIINNLNTGAKKTAIRVGYEQESINGNRTYFTQKRR